VPHVDRPDPSDETEGRPLAGYRVGVTAARKVDEQRGLLERRGATVEWAPALSVDPNRIDVEELRAATAEVVERPVDTFVATTGIGMRAWLDAVAEWGMCEPLLERLAASEILARGPKSVGALRRHGLRELWAPESERFDEVLEHLRGRDLRGRRIVVQEHGQSLSMVAHALRRQGADVTTVTVYRLAGAEDPEPLFRMIDHIAEREIDAVTFTSAPAVAALLDAAASTGRREDVVTAFQGDVVACAVGPVTAAAFEIWNVPTVLPGRSRLAAMVRQLELVLPLRRHGVSLDVAGCRLLVHGDQVTVDGEPAVLSPTTFALLQALLVAPGRVVSRGELLTALPSGTAGSEHAVEMAVARLRSAVGTELVQTVVKRGYRLAVTPDAGEG
jgi:uroporphyrinogen-III synthase